MINIKVAAHSKSIFKRLLWAAIFATIILTACQTQQQSTQASIPVSISVDGSQKQVGLPAGLTVQAALERAGVKLNNLDQVDPPSFTVITSSTKINVKRIREEFAVEESTVPFQTQTVYNESLPEKQVMQIQAGINGVQQITYRKVFENNIEISRSVFKVVTITEARPEIVMVGVQTPFTPVSINGRLAYLSAGNAWIMETTTSSRRPLITSGDLDGRIFSLSPDGKWLLFTRKPAKSDDQTINTLWVADTTVKEPKPINLRAKNIIHFADWVPGTKTTIDYSTVEPRATAPGWQANNDLQSLTFTASGGIARQEEIIGANSGGIYGWWGTAFAWAPDGERLAYARPDGIGLVNFDQKKLTSLEDLTPLQTRGDWAWVPGLGWSPDSGVLYSVTHVSLAGLTSDEASPLFDLKASIISRDQQISLVRQSGMFAYPVPSPYYIKDKSFWIAYLQAVFPEQSETSRYRLVVMDRDGSNRQPIFPTSGSLGLEPQKVVWGPLLDDKNGLWISVIYQGNLWLVNPQNGQSQQITGDGSIVKIDWK